MRIRPNFAFERELWGRGVTAVAGVDEVGVGAFAGPVVAAAVVLAPGTTIDGLADSKLLSPKRHKDLFAVISRCALAIGIGRTEVEEVDRLNIYWAAMEARRRAVEALPTTPAHILVDGKHRIAGCRVSQTAVVDGDALSASVAAASIVAKVTRDSIMEEYAQLYPGYGFEGTRAMAWWIISVHCPASGRCRFIVGHSRQCGERADHNRSLHCGAISSKRGQTRSGAPFW
jgi:ribonuclease HII